MTQQRRKLRLSREQWLEAALDVLAREGEGRIRVRELATALGVTTGSFYWHFENRADFLDQIVRYWRDQYSTRIATAAAARGGSPRQQLEALGLDVIQSDAARFDVPIRAWACHEAGVAEIVAETDAMRQRAVRKIFERCGFKRAAAGLRARVLISDLSMARAMSGHSREGKRMTEFRKLLDILCASAPRD